jgi:hypothetical protein
MVICSSKSPERSEIWPLHRETWARPERHRTGLLGRFGGTQADAARLTVLPLGVRSERLDTEYPVAGRRGKSGAPRTPGVEIS